MTGSLLIFQTMTTPGDDRRDGVPEDLPLLDRNLLRKARWPKISFIEHRLAGDPTNWWVPSPPAVEAMLRSSGFRVTKRLGREVYLCEPDRANPSSFWTWNEREYWRAVGPQGRPAPPAKLDTASPARGRSEGASP